jgi:hypothetical protein
MTATLSPCRHSNRKCARHDAQLGKCALNEKRIKELKQHDRAAFQSANAPHFFK